MRTEILSGYDSEIRTNNYLESFRSQLLKFTLITPILRILYVRESKKNLII